MAAAAAAARSLLRSSASLLRAAPERSSASSAAMRPPLRRALAAPPRLLRGTARGRAGIALLDFECGAWGCGCVAMRPCGVARSPVESSFCVESLLPLHSATADARMTSMLAIPGRGLSWLTQGPDETR